MDAPTIGERCHRVYFDQRSEVKGQVGGSKGTWAAAGDAWAAIRFLSGVEANTTAGGGGQTPVVSVLVIVPNRQGLTERHRLRHGSAVYNIRGIDDYTFPRTYLVLRCSNDGSNGK